MSIATRLRETRQLPTIGSVRLPPAPPAGGRRRRFWPLLAAVALVAGAAVGLEVSGGSTTYPVKAVFAQTPGLFPGAAVNLLGVRVGTVTSVQNVADVVVVGMQINRTDAVPAGVIASFESPALLGEPDIELSPGYAGGPRLARGAVVPESRTTEPVSTDQVLKDLSNTLNHLDPHAVGQLVANLAQDLQGEGQSLHTLITGAAGTLQLLAAKGNDLGQLNGTLAQLTGSLDSRTSEIESLITNYDTVSGVLAGHSTQLSDAITQLTNATTDLVDLLTPNLAPLEQDVGTITTAGRTVDRNIGSIDEGLAQSVLLFNAAGRAYDPTYNWLNLNNQLPPGVTGDYVAGLIRDRLAGVCRRILANFSTGLSATEIATLAACGNPASGFFNPVLSTVATVLSATGSGLPSGPPSPASLFQQGLSEIPGVPGTSGSTSSGSGSASSSSTSTTTTTPTKPTCVLLVVCQASSDTAPGSQATATTATEETAAPSLTAPAARLLPPMPKGLAAGSTVAGAPHHHRHHRGRPASHLAGDHRLTGGRP